MWPFKKKNPQTKPEIYVDFSPIIAQNIQNEIFKINKLINKHKVMSEEKSITIQCPEGYEVDKEKSTFDKIVFKKKENALPMSYEELGLLPLNGYYISSESEIIPALIKHKELNKNRNIWPTKELAEAALALSQLLQLRARWIGDWVPDWTNESELKAVIFRNKDILHVDSFRTATKILSFPHTGMAQQFYETFHDLIRVAKPLL